jgi:23S rRNA (cytosine1962-C5)-methyltransferase
MSETLAPLLEAAECFFAQSQAEARRIFHGRGQLYPGLEHICLDWYPPLVLVSAYDVSADSLLPVDSLLAADQMQQIQSVVLQRRYEQGAPAETVHGEVLENITVLENGSG